MNGLQTLYLESILGVKLGAMNYNATEFEGHLEMSDLERLCNEGMLSWQNPGAPRSDVAYVVAHFDKGQNFKMSIDTKTNTIVVVIEDDKPEHIRPRQMHPELLKIQQVGRSQRIRS